MNQVHDPPIHLAVIEFNVPDIYKSELKERFNKQRPNTWATWFMSYWANSTENLIFKCDSFGKNAVYVASDDGSRVYAVDGDISSIIRWISPTMIVVYTSRCDPLILRYLDQVTVIATPEGESEARLKALVGASSTFSKVNR